MINFAFKTNFTHNNCLVSVFLCLFCFGGMGVVVLGIVMKRIYLNCNLSKRSSDDSPCGTIDLLPSLSKTKKGSKKLHLIIIITLYL